MISWLGLLLAHREYNLRTGWLSDDVLAGTALTLVQSIELVCG
ncbi:hypothetical protein [Thermocrispum agreste]|nr:hypothetical protein [Thermocrispum agreste]